jgi:hypothetical protein
VATALFALLLALVGTVAAEWLKGKLEEQSEEQPNKEARDVSPPDPH